MFSKKKAPATMKVSKRKHKYDSVTAHLKEMLKVDILKGADNVSLRYVLESFVSGASLSSRT